MQQNVGPTFNYPVKLLDTVPLNIRLRVQLATAANNFSKMVIKSIKVQKKYNTKNFTC